MNLYLVSLCQADWEDVAGKSVVDRAVVVAMSPDAAKSWLLKCLHGKQAWASSDNNAKFNNIDHFMLDNEFEFNNNWYKVVKVGTADNASLGSRVLTYSCLRIPTAEEQAEQMEELMDDLEGLEIGDDEEYLDEGYNENIPGGF